MLGRAVQRWAKCLLAPLLLAPLLLAPVCVPQAAAQEVGALTRAYNASGLALYRELARSPGNMVLSPYSIGSALAMARSGARGATEREMASALKHTLARDAADGANAALLAILNGYDGTRRPDYCPEGARWTGKQCEAPPSAAGACPPLMQPERGVCVGGPTGPSATLVAANALVLPKGGAPVSDAYRATVRDRYAAAVHEGVVVGEINAWVKQTTAGKIDRILDQLPQDAGPVLVNAVYLKAAWASVFAKAATREDDFQLSASKRVRVPMMRQDAEFALVERTGYRAVRLDYSQPALSMVVVLPNEIDGLDRAARRLDAGELAALLAALKKAPHRPVALALPRFKASYAADLVAPLQKAGMKLAFGDAADFGGMTGTQHGGLKIGAIKHRAVIEVNEAGTEAAAATSIVMVPTSAPLDRPRPVPFAVDRPFLFYVADDASGAVLFQGRITDPRQQE